MVRARRLECGREERDVCTRWGVGGGARGREGGSRTTGSRTSSLTTPLLISPSGGSLQVDLGQYVQLDQPKEAHLFRRACPGWGGRRGGRGEARGKTDRRVEQQGGGTENPEGRERVWSKRAACNEVHVAPGGARAGRGGMYTPRLSLQVHRIAHQYTRGTPPRPVLLSLH